MGYSGPCDYLGCAVGSSTDVKSSGCRKDIPYSAL